MIRITIVFPDIDDVSTFEGSCPEAVAYLIKTALSMHACGFLANALREEGNNG